MPISYRAAQTLIKRNDFPALTTALDAGLDPNATNHKGWSLLMLAAIEGHVPLGQILIERGADLAAMNLRGETALSVAEQKNHADFAALLREPNA
jgi:ankyrin repeat protein